MSRTIALNCTWSGGLVYIRPGTSVLVPVAALDASNQLYKIEALDGELNVHAFSRTDEQYGSVTTYHYDGAYASLGSIFGVTTAGTIVPEYDQYGEVKSTGTVQFHTDGPSEMIWRILHSGAVVSGNIDAAALSLRLTLSDDKAGLDPVCNPTSGHVDPTVGTLLQWSFSDIYTSYDMPTQTGAVVTWQVVGSSTNHTINAGTSQSVTIPAGSFAQGDQIRWKVKVTANTGVEKESQWMTLTTTDGAATAVPVSPVSGIVDGTAAVEFRWSHTTEYGTAQTQAELQQSADGTVWTTLATVTGAAQFCTVPAGGLNAAADGTFFWRVRTYNADRDAGEWSAPAQCVVVAPPAAPDVYVDAMPAAVISWTAAGQEGYQVQVAGYDTGALYGTEKRWAVPEELPDGSYTARVRVVNGFGLWSAWGEWAFSVQNIPGGTLQLEGTGGRAAILNWTAPDLADGKESTGTNAGVTYTWSSSAKTFTITRTSSNTSTSLRTIFGDYGFSDGLRKGETYRFRWSGCSVAGVHFGLQFYNGSTSKSGTAWLANDQTEGLLTIPSSGITGARACLFVESSSSPSGAVVSGLEVRRVYDRYDVYRDGARIAAVADPAWQDNTAGVGSHVYVVRGRTNGSGYYTESNAVTLTVKLNTVEILDEETGEALSLPMALAEDVMTMGNRKRAAVLQHWNGAGLPSAEIGEALDAIVQLRPSFPPKWFDLAERLERLPGKLIHYRDPYGHAFYGIMTVMNYEKTPRRRTYDLTVTEVDYDPS